MTALVCPQCHSIALTSDSSPDGRWANFLCKSCGHCWSERLPPELRSSPLNYDIWVVPDKPDVRKRKRNVSVLTKEGQS